MRLLPALVAAPVAAAGLLLTQWRHDAAVDEAQARHFEQAHERSTRVAGTVETALHLVYQGLRTMSRLPGVRNIGRHGEGFDDDARQTVQELYNDLASNVSMSEVYIVPRGLEPDRIDPVTGEPEAPIVTFDEMILDRTVDAGEHHDEHEEGEQAEELEIFEYRLMKEQLAWFERHCADAGAVHGLDLPALCGREVVTCDNSRFDPKAPDDADRSGVIYSVPFFGPDGALKGMVSGIVLTHVLRDLLPEGDFAIHHAGYDLTAGSHDDGVWQRNAAAVAAGKPAAGLVYSEVLPLDVLDGNSGWQLWCGQPDQRFLARADVLAADGARVAFGIGAVLLGTLCGGACWLIQLRRRRARADLEAAEERQRLAESQRQALEQQLAVAERSRAAAATMSETAAAIASSTAHLGATSKDMGRSAATAAAESAAVSDAAGNVSRNLEQIASGVRELGLSITEIADNAARAATIAGKATSQADTTAQTVDMLGSTVERIQGVIELIESVAEQTNLLALNATIEAARAGDAGKGFAVVAQEVKQLANETATATKRIETDVAAIRGGTADVVVQIRSIRDTIHSIDAGQSSIAGAVEEQSATSKEMEQRLAETAHLAADIAQRIQQLAHAAAATSSGVAQSEQAVAALDTMVTTLREVGDQLATASS